MVKTVQATFMRMVFLISQHSVSSAFPRLSGCTCCTYYYHLLKLDMHYVAKSVATLVFMAITSGLTPLHAFSTTAPLHKSFINHKLRFTSRHPRLLERWTISLLGCSRYHTPWQSHRLYKSKSDLSSPGRIFGRPQMDILNYSPERKPRVESTPGMSSDGVDGDTINPLRRNDAERAGINMLITTLASTPMDLWKPDILESHLPSLLKGGLFRQTMMERLAKARSGEEQQTLTRIDAFLTGYLGQEKRRGSRAKVSKILSAATAGPLELDQCIKTLSSKDQLDDDLRDYLATLVKTEENKCTESVLLQVLRAVRDRVEAEITVGSRPEIRTLAQALTMENPRERKKYLEESFTKLEDLDEFVQFIKEGIEFMGSEFSFAAKTNMPQENFGKMKAIYSEATTIRRKYLQ